MDSFLKYLDGKQDRLHLFFAVVGLNIIRCDCVLNA